MKPTRPQPPPSSSGSSRLPDASGEATRLFEAVATGQADAHALLPVVYDELRRLASARLAHEPAGQTLQPTALVHEVWLGLVDSDREKCWDSRGHFFAAAAEAMRRILIDDARRKLRRKRGGKRQRVDLLDVDATVQSNDHECLLALDQALQDFAAESPDKVELVKLRYFAGLGEAEAAEILGISRATAARWWAFARAWLFDRLDPK